MSNNHATNSQNNPKTNQKIVNSRQGAARPRELILGELVQLQLPDNIDRSWFERITFRYDCFVQSFRKYEEDLYVLIDKYQDNNNNNNPSKVNKDESNLKLDQGRTMHTNPNL